MRERVAIQAGWVVSISARDAELAASGAWSTAELECAADVENHPRVIELVGEQTGYGKRPLSGGPEGLAPTKNGVRLPHPFLCYAQRVPIPAEYAGQRIFLTLDNVRYHVTLHIDSRQVCHYVGGWEPHRIDITSFVTPGKAAMIRITVGDSGVSGKKAFDPYNYTGTRLPTCLEIQDNLVHPVAYGGSDRAVGKVTLETAPPVRVDYVFANPKVSRGVLCYTVALVNDSETDATVRVQSEAVGAKTLFDEPAVIPAHGQTTITREIPWPDAIRWDTDHPHLYDLRTVVSTGSTTLDMHEDYFGFREFTIDGNSYYLNGKKIHLHGNSGHVDTPQESMSLEEKMRFFTDWKEQGHVNHVRMHARPRDKRWVEAADRVGMLITTESALWTTGFYSFDWVGQEEGCYENVRQHFLEGLVRRDRNNPSVIIWSLSNEMSPITVWDLENPKMAAMTRVFQRIIAETEAEDDSRVIQMSSAMDFIGNLKMYNLHYPKNWQAFPDYPHTAYWLDGSFLFPWYGMGRAKMPAWSWRKDKPLYIGEFTCVFGATPDCQACIVGDVAFEDADSGTGRVNTKLWPLEVKAYRRRDVSGFCAWAFLLGAETDVAKVLRMPQVAAHTDAVRPLAVLDHSYRTQYFSNDEVAIELSIHNDTRDALELALRCEVWQDARMIWTETMPAATYGPAEHLAFTHRFRAPETDARLELQFRATLTAGEETVDTWSKTLAIWPTRAERALPADCAFYDPEGILADKLAKRGLTDAVCLTEIDPLTDLRRFRALWLNFNEAKVHAGDWRRLRGALRRFVEDGGCVILDQPTTALDDLPIVSQNGKGFAEDERLEITYAYNRAPRHPVTRGFSDPDFSLWGDDYYLAHRCLQTPQAGNAVPLLLAGADKEGLVSSPLLEIRQGRGAWLVSTLDLFGKLDEAPVVSDLLLALAAYRPTHAPKSVGLCAEAEALRRYREIGLQATNGDLPTALQQEVALIDGEHLRDANLSAVRAALDAGHTVYLHDLDVETTHRVLDGLGLPGEVSVGTSKAHEHDLFRYTHPLTDGLTHGHLFWVIDRAKLPPWSAARLHPHPASALITLADGDPAHTLTRHGAVTVYPVGAGQLIIDNLRWQDDGIDDPERPRRYLLGMLTNLGVTLTGAEVREERQDFETAEERRERGHF